MQAAHAARVVLAHDLLGIAEPGRGRGRRAGDPTRWRWRRSATRATRRAGPLSRVAARGRLARHAQRSDRLRSAWSAAGTSSTRRSRELVRALGAGAVSGADLAGVGRLARARSRSSPIAWRRRESGVAFARAGYNEAARRYNTELRTVPGRWWHRFMYSTMAPRPKLRRPRRVGRTIGAARPDAAAVRRPGPPAAVAKPDTSRMARV